MYASRYKSEVVKKLTSMSIGSEREDHLRRGSNVSPFESLVAGSISGAVARAVTAPLDTVKIRFQLSSLQAEHKTGTEIIKELLRKEGISAFWKGNVPAELLYILYGASQFTTYSILNKSFADLQNRSGTKLGQSIHSLLVGSGTGLVSTVLTYPFDLLRTRLAAHSDKGFLSMRATCKSIYSKKGILGFYAGMTTSAVSVVANSGLFFWSYSLARRAAENFSEYTRHKVWGIEAICGFTAGFTAKALTFPLDTIRKRIQVTSKTRALHMFRLHWQQYGIGNFYRGFGVSLLKTAPTSAVSIAVYEYAISATRLAAETF